MNIISKILVKPLGFSNGWAELTPKNPPPFVPICFMDSNAATGPRVIDCVSPSNVVTISVGSKV
jgi:hypothetical protein